MFWKSPVYLFYLNLSFIFGIDCLYGVFYYVYSVISRESTKGFSSVIYRLLLTIKFFYISKLVTSIFSRLLSFLFIFFELPHDKTISLSFSEAYFDMSSASSFSWFYYFNKLSLLKMRLEDCLDWLCTMSSDVVKGLSWTLSNCFLSSLFSLFNDSNSSSFYGIFLLTWTPIYGIFLYFYYDVYDLCCPDVILIHLNYSNDKFFFYLKKGVHALLTVTTPSSSLESIMSSSGWTSNSSFPRAHPMDARTSVIARITSSL